MKNISITKSNKKINQNLIYYKNIYNIIEYPIEYSIYKYYYAINSAVDYFFIDSDVIGPEIDSFIKEFSKKIKFIINVFENNDSIIQKYQDYIYLAIGQQNIEHSLYKKYSSYIINDVLYLSSNKLDLEKKEQFIYFLDNKQQIPNVLQNNLYPNTKLPIKMFNGTKNISHFQHLGHITENDRKKVLQESKYYLYDNADYLIEAQLCGCLCINIIDTFDIAEISPPIENYTTYNDLLKEILC
jgi:hypothetical protein